jgi:type VI secretion system ImpM family protein
MFGLFKRTVDTKPDITRQDEYGFLGKTALRPDFIKFQVNARESIGLDHWIKEGFAYASRNPVTNSSNNLFGLSNLFFMAGNDNEANLVGSISPSVDSSGRHYPFVSFVHAGQALYRRHPAALFLNQHNDFHQLQHTAEQVFAAESIDDMQSHASQLQQMCDGFRQPTNINQLLEAFRHIPMQTLWRAIDIDDCQQRALIIQESSLILQSMANRGCLRSQQGLRFPMPSLGNGFEIIAAFWLHLVTVLVADHNWRPWVFFQIGGQDQAASLTIFTTPVPPSYFSCVWSPEVNHQSIIDFASLSASQPLSDKVLSLAKTDNVSMYDALRRWCKA